MSWPPDNGREERVIGAQARELRNLREGSHAAADVLEDGIARAEALAATLGAGLPRRRSLLPVPVAPTAAVPTFHELAAAAPPGAGLRDALDDEENEAALARLDATGRKPDAETSLDRWDWAIAGMAGLLAGAADLVLVGLPQNPITRFGAEGSPLSNCVRSAFRRVLPPETVARLEMAYPVPFDPSTNNRLLHSVPGLYPLSHRFQSLGHDPLLGWIFGVRDVLAGTFTAIGRDGALIAQQVAAGAPGENLCGGLLDAFWRVGGHMLSDVSTPMGLPAPLMPLAQFLQFGTIGPEGHSIAETARRMYLEGYDFRHFTAGGLVTAIVEVIVRGAWVARRLHEGGELRASLPHAAVPRLRRQLLVGHAAAAAVNAGKVAVLHNPCALNWAQWLALFRYLGPELAHLPIAASERAAAQDAMLDADLRDLSRRADLLATPGAPFWPVRG